jgi:hypothetical protein
MYDLVDRPVTRLAPGGRFLLQAMRGWIHAATIGHCPPGMLAPVFARHGVLSALPPFHHLMLHFNHRALGTLAFAPLACARIGEDEAVLLRLCEAATASPCHATATLRLLVEEDAVEPAFAALLTMAARLRAGGLGVVGLGHRGTAAPR